MWQVIVLLLYVAEAAEVGGHHLQNKRETDLIVDDNTTIVLHHKIKHSSSVAMVEREKLEDLPAYMELREDPINLLPPAFTICSTAISATGDIVFFTLLGEDGNQVLCPHISNDPARRTKSNNSVPYLFVSESLAAAPRVLGLLFPRDRVRSCLAVSTESGLVQWVIEGHVVVNETFGVLTQGGLLPQGLAGRLQRLAG